LHEELPHAEFFAFSRSEMDLPVESTRWNRLHDSSPFWSQMPGLFWLRWRLPSLMRLMDLDIFWGTAGLLPSPPRSLRTLLTIHDFNVIVAPQTMPIENRAAFRLFQRNDILSADVLTTNSHGTAARLKGFYRKSAAAVVAPAVSQEFLQRATKPDWSLLEHYGLRLGRYWLMVSNLEPRKNTEIAVQALLAMKRTGENKDIQLAVCGATGWKNQRIARLLERSYGAGVRRLQFVRDEHLPTLFSGAMLFLYPSVYEGFGLPVLEALSCGTPVVTTDLPELREASLGLAHYVSPTVEGVLLGVQAAMSCPRPSLLGAKGVPTWQHSGELLARVMVDMAP
jgi:glycosyltransferase involved in cell wall biosynthesis